MQKEVEKRWDKKMRTKRQGEKKVRKKKEKMEAVRTLTTKRVDGSEKKVGTKDAGEQWPGKS